MAAVLPAPASEASDDTAVVEALARRVLSGLQKGSIDRSLFTANANFYFDEQALHDYASSLGPLGEIKMLRQTSTSLRGGMRYRAFAAEFSDGTRVTLSTYWTPAGSIEQFLVAPVTEPS
jgi:hypothetical protein